MSLDLERNKETFIELLSEVNRQGIEELIEKINTTDFFEAPASTHFHMCEKGGLCEHSLNVFNNLVKLNDLYEAGYSKESMILVALLHDVSKTGMYEYYVQNRKSYGVGTQHDDYGNFTWVQVGAYKVKDDANKERVCAEHGVSSFLFVNDFVKLTEEETAAIINHHMDLDKSGYVRTDISEIYNRYPLASMLHIADTMATYLDENPYRTYE